MRKSLAALRLHPNLQRSIEDKISELVPMSEEMINPGDNRIAPAGFREKALLMSRRDKGDDEYPVRNKENFY